MNTNKIFNQFRLNTLERYPNDIQLKKLLRDAFVEISMLRRREELLSQRIDKLQEDILLESVPKPPKLTRLEQCYIPL